MLALLVLIGRCYDGSINNGQRRSGRRRYRQWLLAGDGLRDGKVDGIRISYGSTPLVVLELLSLCEGPLGTVLVLETRLSWFFHR
jgi:hypothetical protein